MGNRVPGFASAVGCAGAGIFIWLAVVGALLTGWITHIVVCIQHHDLWLLVIGFFIFPVGIIHGWGCLFHWWG